MARAACLTEERGTSRHGIDEDDRDHRCRLHHSVRFASWRASEVTPNISDQRNGTLYRLLASPVTAGSGPPDTQITEAVETIDKDVTVHLSETGLPLL